MYSTHIYEKDENKNGCHKMAAKVTFAIEKWLFQQFLKMIMQKPEGLRPKTVIDCTKCHQDNRVSYGLLWPDQCMNLARYGTFVYSLELTSLVGMVFYPNRCVKWVRCVHKMDVRTKFNKFGQSQLKDDDSRVFTRMLSSKQFDPVTLTFDL